MSDVYVRKSRQTGQDALNSLIESDPRFSGLATGSKLSLINKAQQEVSNYWNEKWEIEKEEGNEIKWQDFRFTTMGDIDTLSVDVENLYKKYVRLVVIEGGTTYDGVAYASDTVILEDSYGIGSLKVGGTLTPLLNTAYTMSFSSSGGFKTVPIGSSVAEDAFGGADIPFVNSSKGPYDWTQSSEFINFSLPTGWAWVRLELGVKNTTNAQSILLNPLDGQLISMSLTQSGTNAPAGKLKNNMSNIGITPSRTGTGDYLLTFDSAILDADKTAVFCSPEIITLPAANKFSKVTLTITSTSTIQVVTEVWDLTAGTKTKTDGIISGGVWIALFISNTSTTI